MATSGAGCQASVGKSLRCTLDIWLLFYRPLTVPCKLNARAISSGTSFKPGMPAVLLPQQDTGCHKLGFLLMLCHNIGFAKPQ